MAEFPVQRTQKNLNSSCRCSLPLFLFLQVLQVHLPESSRPVDRCNLTTVYYKLEAHLMVPIHTGTADHVYDQTMEFPHTRSTE